jgi:ubiquinone/menaquinone biosynthesis C-methylase UbiE
MDLKKKYYSTKNYDYFTLPREDIIQCVPYGKNTVLEIGCGNGATLFELRKTGRAREIVGVDISSKSLPLDNFISGDI